MATTQHCGDQSKHASHTYYGPTHQKNGEGQVEYYCPGTR